MSIHDVIDFVEEYGDDNEARIAAFTQLADEVRRLREQQEDILTVLREYGDQLGPALDALKNSAFGKMFGMG